MEYLLRYSITETDCDFLNETTIAYRVVDTKSSLGIDLSTIIDEVDSGWHDMMSGARIISEQDRIIFKDVSPEELTLLTLKFGVRIKKLVGGMTEIYKEAEQHNASPNAVIDSETII